MTIIDIGYDAIDRDTYWTPGGYTSISKGNPANAAGKINTVEIRAQGLALANVIAGTFYKTNANTLKCRDSEACGNVPIGTKVTFTGLTIDVEVGDYIGLYATAGRIEDSSTGGDGFWYVSGQYIDPNDEATYTSAPNEMLSIYGSGATPAGGSKGFIIG